MLVAESKSAFDLTSSLEYTGYAALVLFGVVGIIFLVFLPLLIANWLGNIKDRDIFFKRVEEGRARAVMLNGQFSKMIMTYKGFKFGRVKNPGDPASYWDIVLDEEHSWVRHIPIFGGLIGGLKWIGIWPFAEIHRYTFDWVSWDLPKTGSGSSSARITASEKTSIPHTERLSHILVQKDVYYMRVGEAETRLNPNGPVSDTPTGGQKPRFEPGIPVDLELLLTISIVNPYKALFRTQHWLELVTNQLEAFVREFIGRRQFEELFADTEASSNKLTAFLKKETDRIMKEFGVHIELIQIQSVQPAGDLAGKYRALSTLAYEAQQKATARETEAGAEKTFLQKTLGAAAKNPATLEAYKWQQIGESNLTTYMEGGGKPGQRVQRTAGVAITPTSPATATSESPASRPSQPSQPPGQ